MCGIAIKFRNNFCEPSRIAHRGIVKSEIKYGDFTLTHYKLPLQTFRDDEFNQPIKLKNGNYLMYNGEIFNFPGNYKNDVDYLKAFFSDENWQAKVGGLEYNLWDGFWSICIVTPQRVYAFTDPLGKKQLYYKDGCIASEIKPLIEDLEFCPLYNWDQVENTNDTPFRGVKRIRPNKLYWFDQAVVSRMSGNLFDLMRKTNSFDLYTLMERSVESRLINLLDKNTLFVSGGLDSTIILHHLHKLGVLSGFELLTIDNDKDGKYIDEIESYFNCTVKRLTPQDLSIDEMREILVSYEHPIERGSLFQQYRLCQAASGSVIYSGDGADELFSGYNRAQISDTQIFDVFVELPYYHNIRLDRICMAVTKENRSPFLSHDVVRFALNMPYADRRGKKILKDLYRGRIPDSIIDRKKTPLREENMRLDRKQYTNKVHEIFKTIIS